MQKQNVRVVVTTAANYSVTADDAVLNGQGTAAYGAIETKTDVIVRDGGDIKYIPYAAIDHAEITLTLSTEPDPQDDTCVEEPAPTPPTP